MMRQLGIDIQTRQDKAALLEVLERNRATHKTMVAEANAGYLVAARGALAKRLAEIESGKVVGLAFEFVVPRDFTSSYDTVIAMLKTHTDSTVALSASEYRKLVEDEWDWAWEFAGSNAAYSNSTSSWAASKGL